MSLGSQYCPLQHGNIIEAISCCIYSPNAPPLPPPQKISLLQIGVCICLIVLLATAGLSLLTGSDVPLIKLTFVLFYCPLPAHGLSPPI